MPNRAVQSRLCRTAKHMRHLSDETGVAATDQSVTLKLKLAAIKWWKDRPKARQGSRRDQKIKRDLRGGRWSWTLNFAQKRSWVGSGWSWAQQVGPQSFASTAVQRTLSLWLCPSTAVETAARQLRSAQVVGQWPGDTALTPASIVL